MRKLRLLLLNECMDVNVDVLVNDLLFDVEECSIGK